jgi:hypothetical protein
MSNIPSNGIYSNNNLFVNNVYSQRPAALPQAPQPSGLPEDTFNPAAQDQMFDQMNHLRRQAVAGRSVFAPQPARTHDADIKPSLASSFQKVAPSRTHIAPRPSEQAPAQPEKNNNGEKVGGAIGAGAGILAGGATGAQAGAIGGTCVAGPLGAVIGGVGGAIVGAVVGGFTGLFCGKKVGGLAD